jgi:hypothetical protein
MVNHQRFSYIGIEPLANANAFAFVSLDEQLNLLAIGEGGLKDVFSYLIGQEALLVGVHAPGFLGKPVGQFPLSPDISAPPAKSCRLCELQAWQESIPVEFTPAKASVFSAASRHGYQLLQMLQRYGFAFYNQNPANKILIETQPAACYYQLINTQPLPEDAFLGRLQRQLILHEHKLPVQDPMDFFEEITRHKIMMGKVSLKSFLLSQELNAMVIAYTAWLFHQQPDRSRLFGNDSDGVLILPSGNQTGSMVNKGNYERKDVD